MTSYYYIYTIFESVICIIDQFHQLDSKPSISKSPPLINFNLNAAISKLIPGPTSQEAFWGGGGQNWNIPGTSSRKKTLVPISTRSGQLEPGPSGGDGDEEFHGGDWEGMNLLGKFVNDLKPAGWSPLN